MNGRVEIRIALPGDAKAVAEIGRVTFYETWRPVNSEDDMQLYMKGAFDEDKIKADISNSDLNLFLVVFCDSQLIGYAKMRRDRTYDEFKGMKSIEIERIYLKKEWQEKKIGKSLMDRCIELAKTEQNSWLWLAVNDENKKAINFYLKFGFEFFGTKKFKLGTAEDTDFLMKLKIN